MQRLIPVLLVVLLVAGCSNLRFPGVYRIDIPQGNFVTPEMLDELRPGMSREQVSYVLGPPTLRDPFTPNQWHYLLDYKPGKGEAVQQEIVIHFDDEGLARREGQALANLQAKTQGRQDRELKEKIREGQDAIQQATSPAPGPQPGAGGGAPAPTGGTSPQPGRAPQPGSPSPQPGL
jgi:outer membrane protein assembly factor BamE